VGARASERAVAEAAHHRRHQTLAGSLVVLQPARVAQAQPRTAADEKSARAPVQPPPPLPRRKGIFR